jgi:hypothetical protein
MAWSGRLWSVAPRLIPEVQGSPGRSHKWTCIHAVGYATRVADLATSSPFPAGSSTDGFWQERTLASSRYVINEQFRRAASDR